LDFGAIVQMLEKYLANCYVGTDTQMDYARVQEGLLMVKEGLRLAI